MKNDEMNLAWQFVKNTGTSIFLTGKAGTGKTTFLRALKDKLPKRMVVVAPTGIAAINANGVTIHSFFQLPFAPYVPNSTFKTEGIFRVSKEKQRILRTLDLLVIDEISMVRADLLDSVDMVLRRYRDRSKPFGGVQLLLIGDLQQLPPVVRDEEWTLLGKYYDSPYFFSSLALKQTGYITIELKHVYRQNDLEFLSLLNKIRDNKADQDTFNRLNNRYIPNFVPPSDTDYIRLVTHNYQAQSINESKLAELPGVSRQYKASITGEFPEQSYPTEFVLELKENAQVMFVKNDSTGKGRYYNGMLGKVVSTTPRGVTVKSNETGELIDLLPEEWTNAKYVLNKDTHEIEEEVEGTFKQFPLRLAWAVTIHKSQGLTFEHAIIDAQHSFAHGQTYVALSRCKTLEGLVLSSPLSTNAVICDEKVHQFNMDASAHQPNSEMLSQMQRAYELNLIDELFDFRPIGIAFERITRFIDEHFARRYPRLLQEYRQARPILDEIVAVAAKFRLQYTQMLATQQGQELGNEVIQRIRSGAEYFHKRLSLLVEMHRKNKIDTDNKALKKTLKERYSDVHEALDFKWNLLKYESREDVSFGIGDYLSAKAKLLLGTMDTDKPNTKKAKEVKPKVDTKLATFNLYRLGMSIDDIAKRRELTKSTICTHLAHYVGEGAIAISEFVDDKKRQEITRFLMKHPEERKTASDIKAELNPNISYEDIRFVMAEYYRNKK
ncbi:helix-turn-helix domain-containing protein [Hoylesella loescheii]|uniref:helix-turn-helix domain-containing protein n=1 Tax=Hoylesella loescheii TaxID=840 RepID=UPI0028EACBA3|nr:helix-turn-helix domain-containing protein [Hoylesella loescheii]